MRKFCLVTAFLFATFAASGQEELKPDLTGKISDGMEITWLDCAQKVFDAGYFSSSLRITRSGPIRAVSANQPSFQISRLMRLRGFSHRWFDDQGQKRLAVIYQIEERYGWKKRIDVLAIYGFAPALELVDAVQTRTDEWDESDAEFGDEMPPLDLGGRKSTSELIHLINRRQTSFKTSEEKHRFMKLVDGKLRVVIQFPVMENYEFCDKTVTHRVFFSKTGELIVERIPSINTWSDCKDDRYMGTATSETYRLERGAEGLVFTQNLWASRKFAVEDWGEKITVFTPYQRGMVMEVTKGYQANAVFDPKTKRFEVMLGDKQITDIFQRLDFYDHYQLAPKNATRIVEGRITFQVTAEDKRTMPDGTRLTVYECLIYSFSEKSR